MLDKDAEAEHAFGNATDNIRDYFHNVKRIFDFIRFSDKKWWYQYQRAVLATAAGVFRSKDGLGKRRRACHEAT
ncbi:MAG: hypothetical protein JXA69_13075 [Phycisphaerae bacterium]|nr:hypothetical protein [Phycisphaerae bacterium]